MLAPCLFQDSPFTNAGMGSNLNLLGEIECDASIMDGKTLHYGAVGALSGECCLLTEKQNKTKKWGELWHKW